MGVSYQPAEVATRQRPDLPTYRLCGATFASAVDLMAPAGTAPIAATILLGDGTSAFTARPESDRLYVSPFTDGGRPRAFVDRIDGGFGLWHAGAGMYAIGDDRVVVHRDPDADDTTVREILAGGVLALWLELHGTPAFHASAVAVQGGAVAFLNVSGAGKTTLAASFVQSGCQLITDDLLAVEQAGGVSLAHPALPSMNMSPDQVAFFHAPAVCPPDGSSPRKRRIPLGADSFGQFAPSALPLRRIYIPERRDPADPDSAVEITPVPHGEALIMLLRHSFVARVIEALGVQENRLGVLAALVRSIPLRRLRYPSGFEHLAALREAVRRDLVAGSSGG